MLQAVTADDHALVGTLGEAVANLRFAFAQIEQADVLAMGHDRADVLLVEAQHVGDDRLLACVKDACSGALIHQDLDLVVADRGFLRMVRTEQSQQQAG
jgi:hypothetical protein